jgi:hypothetical protein
MQVLPVPNKTSADSVHKIQIRLKRRERTTHLKTVRGWRPHPSNGRDHLLPALPANRFNQFPIPPATAPRDPKNPQFLSFPLVLLRLPASPRLAAPLPPLFIPSRSPLSSLITEARSNPLPFPLHSPSRRSQIQPMASTGNAPRSRKRVEATVLKRARDGSAFTRW